VGDHPESSLLLPGGSRVEGFDVESISSPPASNRRRRVAVSFITTVAVIACLATISVQSMPNGDTPVEMVQEKAAAQSPAEKLTSNLPSWLRTPSVKLLPLNRIVKEQELVRKEAAGQISHKLVEEEHEKTGPTPHSLAMKNVEGQQTAAPAQPKAAPATTKQPPAIQPAVATAKPQAVPKPLAAHSIVATPAEKHISARSPEEELKAKQKALARLMMKQARDETKIKKQELHKLAALKQRDSAKEAALQGQIKALKAEESNTQLTNEKAKLKAQMAQIEEEEHEKLAKLQSKMAHLAPQQAAAPAQAAKPAVAPAPEAHRAHAVFAKKAVTVHHAEEAASNKARETQLTWGDGEKKNRICTDDTCDTQKEDSKWLAHKSSVDKFAQVAMQGSGKAKAKALAHMRELQKQIEADYKHVTGFAVTQEHALPPVQH